MKFLVSLLVLWLAAAAGVPAHAQAPAGSAPAVDTSADARASAAAQAAAAAPDDAPPATPRGREAFSRALAISGTSLVVIFFVMALFAGLIALLGRVYPGTEGEST